MTATIRPERITEVQLTGLDLDAAPELRERLIDVLHGGTELLILDLSGVSSCDAAGLAVLIGTQRRARLLGAALRLVAPSLPVRQVLRSTGLERSLTICADVAEARLPDPRRDTALASSPAVLAAAV
jgi:anti-anti-sigma factor